MNYQPPVKFKTVERGRLMKQNPVQLPDRIFRDGIYLMLVKVSDTGSSTRASYRASFKDGEQLPHNQGRVEIV